MNKQEIAALINMAESKVLPKNTALRAKMVEGDRRLLAAIVRGVDVTPREREAIELVAEGLTDTEIAERMGISVWTAKDHVRRGRRKLGVRGQRRWSVGEAA